MLILKIFFWSFYGYLHPFYVSVVEIEYNKSSKNMETIVKLFTDDFEQTLSKQYRQKIDLTQPTDQAIQLVQHYIQAHLHIQADNQPVALKWVGFEIKQESAWLYFESSPMPDFSKVTVQCSLLYDYQKQQINIFHIRKNQIEKSYKLDFPNTDFSIRF